MIYFYDDLGNIFYRITITIFSYNIIIKKKIIVFDYLISKLYNV